MDKFEEKEFEVIKEQKIIYVPAKPEKGFNVGYFLKYQTLSKDKPPKFFIEGNNGPPEDKPVSTRNITWNNISYEYNFHDVITRGVDNYVVLMPAFMRPIKQLENGKKSDIDYRGLTSEAIWSQDEFNKRVDLQLINMMKDARNILKENENIVPEEKVIAVGFSDSANFAQRFAFLHPELVKGVFIGGMNAMTPLPKSTYKNETLNYPLGANDYEKLVGHPFDFEAYNNIVQYFLLGDQDQNSIVPYLDCITKQERQIIEKIYGKDMQTELWPSMKQAIKACKLKNIKCFKIKGIGHEHPYQDYKPFKNDFFDELKAHEKSLQQEKELTK